MKYIRLILSKIEANTTRALKKRKKIVTNTIVYNQLQNCWDILKKNTLSPKKITPWQTKQP